MIDRDSVLDFLAWPFLKLKELWDYLRAPRKDDQDGDPDDGADLGGFG
jgi:hypothetical protein